MLLQSVLVGTLDGPGARLAVLRWFEHTCPIGQPGDTEPLWPCKRCVRGARGGVCGAARVSVGLIAKPTISIRERDQVPQRAGRPGTASAPDERPRREKRPRMNLRIPSMIHTQHVLTAFQCIAAQYLGKKEGPVSRETGPSPQRQSSFRIQG